MRTLSLFAGGLGSTALASTHGSLPVEDLVVGVVVAVLLFALYYRVVLVPARD